MSSPRDLPLQGAPNTLRQTGQARDVVRKPPLFKGTDFPHSMNLLDMLAGRLMPGVLKLDQSAAANVSHSAISSNPKRVALVFIAPSTGNLTWSTETPVVIQQGINITASNGPVILTSKEVGDLVTKEWYVITTGALVIPSWIEVYGPDNVCLEDQMRQGTNW